MASGQTALSLSDLPFMYSFVNLLFIWSTGDVTDFTRYYIVGLIAGLIGTFFVFWHPIQWLLDKFTMSKQQTLSIYEIDYPNVVPPLRKIIVKEWFSLSLKTSAIKYLKDKIAGQIYFMIILITLFIALLTTNFQQTVGLKDSPHLYVIIVGVVGMSTGIAIFMAKQSESFGLNLKLSALYFLISLRLIGFKEESNVIKQAIDLNDWPTVKEMIDRILHNNWGSLDSYTIK